MKQEIRERIAALRKGLSQEEVVAKSQAIMDKLLELPELSDAKIVIAYDSIGNEVQTTQLMQLLQTKSVAGIPIQRSDKDTLHIQTIHKKERKILNHEPDIIIIPGVAFDGNKNRLGRGGGFYDRYLENVNAKKIALAYDFQLVDKLPTQTHDIPMDLIITEERVIQ